VEHAQVIGVGASRHGRVLDVLHSPLYAGAYVYGRRTRADTLFLVKNHGSGRTRRVKQEEWPIVLLDNHPGYITWDQFRCNRSNSPITRIP